MSRTSLPAWLGVALLVLPGPVRSQEESYPPRFIAGVSVGAAVPSGDVGDVVGTAFSIGFAAGYHLHRVLRLDAAYDNALGSSSTTHTIETTGGSRDVGLGSQEFLRIGPSLALPAPGRLVLTVGGGGAWGVYEESASRNAIIIGFEPASRSGTGRYGTVSLERMVTSVKGSRRGRGLGISVTFYSIGTDGDSLHGLFTGPTRDRWTTISAVAVGHF